MDSCGLTAWQQMPHFDMRTVWQMDAVPMTYNCSSVCRLRKTDLILHRQNEMLVT